MYSGVATGIFSIRNAGKTSNGEVGRLPVTVGQGASLLKAGAQSNSMFAHKTGEINSIFHKLPKEIVTTIKEAAESDKVFNGISKAVKFASDNVNPLIVCSSGLNVMFSEDKQSALLTEGGCIAGMFIGEGLMKKHLDKLLDIAGFTNKKWRPVLKGITFVSGSIGASGLGQKIGKYAAEELKACNERYAA